MATATQGSSALVESAPKREVAVDVSAPSRREFLFYIWGASMVLLLGQTTAGIIWFALPRFKEGEFGGIFRLAGDEAPSAGDAPVNQPAGRFWLATDTTGFFALYAVCTHLGCLPKWQGSNNRFECPCHGSKYEVDGRWIEGPAPRGLDRFRATITFTNGEVASTPSDGGPIPLNGREIASIVVDTGSKIRGPGH